MTQYQNIIVSPVLNSSFTLSTSHWGLSQAMQSIIKGPGHLDYLTSSYLVCCHCLYYVACLQFVLVIQTDGHPVSSRERERCNVATAEAESRLNCTELNITTLLTHSAPAPALARSSSVAGSRSKECPHLKIIYTVHYNATHPNNEWSNLYFILSVSIFNELN